MEKETIKQFLEEINEFRASNNIYEVQRKLKRQADFFEPKQSTNFHLPGICSVLEELLSQINFDGQKIIDSRGKNKKCWTDFSRELRNLEIRIGQLL
jgi:hypothetical protein